MGEDGVGWSEEEHGNISNSWNNRPRPASETRLHAGAWMFGSGQPTPLFDFTASARASVSTLVPLAPESQREQVLGDKQAAKGSQEWDIADTYCGLHWGSQSL